jgi:glycosyltransferase involved in cell wall biosynthesis
MMIQPLIKAAPTQSPPVQPAASAPYLFLFLEVFAQEGGIQSYVKDIFASYLTLTDAPIAEVLLLRDAPHGVNPFASSLLRFQYFKSRFALWGRLRLAIALLMQLLQRRPQRVFCGHINLLPLVRSLCQPLQIPYTVLTYGKEVWMPLSPLHRQALRQANQIWTISRYSRERACAANRLDPQKFRLLPCSVDGDCFTPGRRSAILSQQYGLEGTRVLMTVARLWSGDPYKGVDVTIRALPTIALVVPQVKYLVIGRGDDQPRLAQLAADLGVADRVVFAGFVSSELLVDHYRLADAYVMPSQEGFGIVYLEALACGVPVVSGDADGSADPLQDGLLGWRVPHRDPQAVAAACIALLHAQTAGGLPEDRRCDRVWLRQQTLNSFGKAAFAQRLHQLLTLP